MSTFAPPPSQTFLPPFDKHCTVRTDWQTMRKSDIRYPRATTDPRPAEGHTATENIKCQVWANMRGKGMWPTWHYHTRGCHCPKRDFTPIRQADRVDWQQCYGYFPWQPAEPTGSHEWGGRLCDESQSELTTFAKKRTLWPRVILVGFVFFLYKWKYSFLSHSLLWLRFDFTQYSSHFLVFPLSQKREYSLSCVHILLMTPYASQGLIYPL